MDKATVIDRRETNVEPFKLAFFTFNSSKERTLESNIWRLARKDLSQVFGAFVVIVDLFAEPV